VKKAVANGMGNLELRERHWVNCSWIEAEATMEADSRKRNTGKKEELRDAIVFVLKNNGDWPLLFMGTWFKNSRNLKYFLVNLSYI
jgi:hypothetical protein